MMPWTWMDWVRSSSAPCSNRFRGWFSPGSTWGEYYALEGLSDLLSTVRLVKRKLNPGLTMEGVLLTMRR